MTKSLEVRRSELGTCIDQIFEMFPGRLGVSQVMVLPDQVIEELLFRRLSDLSQSDWCKISQGNGDRNRLKIESCLSFISPL